MFELIRKDNRNEAAWEAVRRIDSAAECLHTVLGNGICIPPLTNQALAVFQATLAAFEAAATEVDRREDWVQR